MRSRISHTIAFRLTLWFTGIFAVCAAVTYGLFYFLAAQTLLTQIDGELVENSAKFSTIITRRGLPGARDLAVVQAQAAGEKVNFYRLLFPSGEVFASSHMSYWKGVGVSSAALRHIIINHGNFFETVRMPASGQKARILYTFVAHNVILQTGIAMDAHTAFLNAFKKVFIGAMVFIILFSALAGWLLVRKVMSGVSRITRTAQDISGTNLHARVQTSGNRDELDHLAETLNSMLDRIEALLKSNREISDNIAHDLKSPVTRIRGHAELALVQEDSIDNYREMAADTIEECDRLLDMINTMLLISRAEARADDFDFQPTHLSAVISEACELFSPLAEDKQISFAKQVESGIHLNVDVKMFQRAFSNLLDNAIKYTQVGGSISVMARVQEMAVIIEISDNGPGISPEDHEKIFQRFFRVESSRTSPGSGLGLNLARTIIRRHHGDIHLESQQGQGARFVIILPVI